VTFGNTLAELPRARQQDPQEATDCTLQTELHSADGALNRNHPEIIELSSGVRRRRRRRHWSQGVGSGIEAGNKVGAQEARWRSRWGRAAAASASRWRGGVSQLTLVSTRSATVSVAAQSEASRPSPSGAGGNATIGSAPGLVGKTTLSLGCQPD
jgi:hypothetical protein